MTLPKFSDRIFYLEANGLLAHIQYLTSDMWALSLLHHDGDWEFDHIGPTYQDVYQTIRPANPTLLLEEPW